MDLADDLSADTVAALRAALLEWKVIFFRDQFRLDRDRHVAFGRAFGDLEVHPLTPKDQEQREIFVIPAGGKHKAPGVWHSDVTWRPEPSLGSILRAVELPPVGGDTLWADMGAAYDLLARRDQGTRSTAWWPCTISPVRSGTDSHRRSRRRCARSTRPPSTPWCGLTPRRAAGRST